MPPKTPDIPPSFDADAVARLLLGEAIDDRLRNRIPVLEPGAVPGSSVISGFRDRRDPTPAGQPEEQRLDAELQFLARNKDFSPQIGKRLENFNIVDPFESGGLFDSITNVTRQAFTQSLTGDIEVAFGKFTGLADELPNAFGLIDLNKAQAFRPNLAEQISSGVASFFMPLDLLALGAGGGIASKGLRVLAKQILRKPGRDALTIAARKIISGNAIPETLSLAERAIPRAVRTSVQLGTYEGSRGFFEGFNNGEDPLEYFYKGAGRGAILGAGVGLAAGVVPFAIGAQKLGEGTRRALAETSRASAEIFTLGTISPFTEGRTPTSEDYINAAGFVLGIKTVGGFASIPRRVFNRRLMAEARRLEKAKDDVQSAFMRVPERTIEADDLYSARFWRNVKAAEPGTEVGKVSDFVKDKQVREVFGEILDTKVKVSNEVPEGFLREGQIGAGWVGFDSDGLFKIFLNPDHPNEMATTMFHEMAHLMRRAKGRELVSSEGQPLPAVERPAEGFAGALAAGIRPRGERRFRKARAITPVSPEAPQGPVTGKVAVAASERAFKRDLNKKGAITVDAEDGRIPTAGVGAETRRNINRLLPRGKARPTKFTFTPNSVVAEFKPGKRNTLLVLDVSGKKVADRVAELNRIVAESGDKPVYVTNRLAKTSTFRRLIKTGVFKKVGNFYRVTDGPDVTFKKVKVPLDPTKASDRQIDLIAEQNREIGEPPAFRILPANARERTEQIGRALIPKIIKQVKNRHTEDEFVKGVKMTLDADSQSAVLRGGYLTRIMDAGLRRLNPTILEKAAGLLPKKLGVKDKFLDESIQMTRDLIDAKVDTVEKRAIRSILNELIAAAEEAKGEKIGFVKNYVPNVMNAEIRNKITGELLDLEREVIARFPNLADPSKHGQVDLKAKVEGKDSVEQVINKLLVSKSRELREVLTFVESKGKLRSKMSAIRFAREYLNEETFAEPSYLKKRALPDWPEHLREMDIRVWLPDYVSSITKYIARQQVFGRKAIKLNTLLRELGRKNFEAEKDLSRAIAMWDGSYELERGLRGKTKTLADWYTGFQVGTKIGMGGATILNLSQPMISIIPALGAYRTLRGAFSLLDPAVRERVRKTGVTDYMTTKAMEAVSGHRPGGFMGRFADFATTVSGFQSVNKALLFLSAATMEIALKDWHRIAGQGGLRSRFAAKKLEEFGIDRNRNIENQEQAMFKAMYRFATDSQLQRNIFNEPFVLNEPIFRPLFLFKRFGLRQAAFMKDLVIQDAKKGNWMPILRLALGGYVGGIGVVWGLNKIKSLLSGEEVYDQNDTLTEEVLSKVSRVGALGFMSDFMELGDVSRFRRTVEFAALPVAVSDLQTVMGATQRFLNDYKRYGEGFLAIRRNAYALGGILGTYPRAAAKRLLTETQVVSRQDFRKSREKTRVFELLLEGKAKAAGDRVASWNSANSENAIRMDEVDSRALVNWIKRKAQSFAAAKSLKDTPTFKRIKRERVRELLSQSRQTRNVGAFRRAANQ